MCEKKHIKNELNNITEGEYLNVADSMGKKRRVESPRKRNYIGVNHPGDKFYNNPEYRFNLFFLHTFLLFVGISQLIFITYSYTIYMHAHKF